MSSTPRQQRDAYDPFAITYNMGMAEDFCRRAWPVVERLLLRESRPPARILDLCCGSGQMARELTHRGYSVVGLDGSSQMLQLARQNAPGAEFVLADARVFSLQARFDAVLSNFNSMAHALSTDELQHIFANAQSALKRGGKFLFDISMEEAYTAKWRGSFGDAWRDVAYIVRPSYDRETHMATNQITVFGREEDEWVRHDVVITQRCFSEEEILGALLRAGFADVKSYDAERDLGMAKEFGRRIFVVTGN